MSFGQNRDAEGTLSNLPALGCGARGAILCVGLLLPALFTWGCSGIVSGQNTTASQPPPQTFSISGTITPVTGGNGATITVTGAANATATANSSGNFTVSGLANGTYTITPSHAGYSFSPSSMNVTISNASVTTGISFTATALTFGISGTLNPAIGGSGATVTLSGPASSTTTSDGAGNYSFSGLANGMYAVTPSHAGYTFNPGTQTATINGANVTGANFTAQASQTFSISATLSRPQCTQRHDLLLCNYGSGCNRDREQFFKRSHRGHPVVLCGVHSIYILRRALEEFTCHRCRFAKTVPRESIIECKTYGF